MFNLLILLCLGQSSIDSTQSTQAASEQKPVARVTTSRSLTSYRVDISAALKGESLAQTTSEKAQWAHRLIAIHSEITSDPRFAENEWLQNQRGKVWSRLLQIRDELKRYLAKQKRIPLSPQLQESREISDILAAHYDFSGQMAGGPTLMMARGGGAISLDYGDELVELIQNTINPATWDVNGGQGTIVYYRPCMALVVRASSSVHEELGGLLGEIR
jgi:hypothetical protein